MRFPIFNVLILAVCLFFSSAGFAKPLDTERVDALITGYGDQQDPGISVAIALDGQVIYEGWKGLADVERAVPINGDTRFAIASVSKQFTAFAIMQLMQEEKLSLDQEVRDFLPQLKPSDRPLTIRHLLDHTGGLREVNSLFQLLEFSDASPITADQALSLILRQKGRNFEPGQQEEYSNTGYQLLAHIVERASGMPFEDYMQTQIFDVLSMKKSSVLVDPAALVEDLALSYVPTQEGFSKSLLSSGTFGSTGIISTPRDLLLWGHALNTGSLSGKAVIDAMAERFSLSNGNIAVASNGQEHRDWRGLKTWSHGGSTGGYRSFLLRIPEQGIVIAVMGNRADFLKAAFAFDVAEALLADSLKPQPMLDMSAETIADLDSYVGDYRLFAGKVVSLRREGEALTFRMFGDEQAFALDRVSKGSFLLDPSRDLRLEFRDFQDGKAKELRWQISKDGFLRAPRVNFAPIPKPITDPNPFTGLFYSRDLQTTIEIFEDEDQLWIASKLREPVPLKQYQEGVFWPVGATPFQQIEYEQAGVGRQGRIIVSTTLAENIVFERLGPGRERG